MGFGVSCFGECVGFGGLGQLGFRLLARDSGLGFAECDRCSEWL